MPQQQAVYSVTFYQSSIHIGCFVCTRKSQKNSVAEPLYSLLAIRRSLGVANGVHWDEAYSKVQKKPNKLLLRANAHLVLWPQNELQLLLVEDLHV